MWVCSLWGRSPGGGHGNPLSILALEIPRQEDRGAQQAIVHRVCKELDTT